MKDLVNELVTTRYINRRTTSLSLTLHLSKSTENRGAMITG